MSSVIAAKAFIKVGEKFLVIKESSDYEIGNNPGKWHLPGGRKKEGEDIRESLKREVREETGLEIEIEGKVSTDFWNEEVDGKDKEIFGVYFECSASEKEVKLSSEHSDYRWIRRDEIDEVEFIGELKTVVEEYFEEKIRTGVEANIIREDGRVLILKRSQDETHLEGVWEIPGGEIEFGQSPQEALREEVREETGLEIEIQEPMNTWKFDKNKKEQIVGVDFLCSPEGEKVELSDEHTKYRWVSREELDDYNIYGSIEESIRKALDIKGKNELPKLVRDRIPEIIRENNQTATTRKVSEAEAEKWLRRKVLEEAKEFEEDAEVEELADLYAVIQEYIRTEDISFSELERIEEEKAEKRGGFKERIILEEVRDE